VLLQEGVLLFQSLDAGFEFLRFELPEVLELILVLFHFIDLFYQFALKLLESDLLVRKLRALGSESVQHVLLRLYLLFQDLDSLLQVNLLNDAEFQMFLLLPLQNLFVIFEVQFLLMKPFDNFLFLFQVILQLFRVHFNFFVGVGQSHLLDLFLLSLV
jgi:hypothetical protein